MRSSTDTQTVHTTLLGEFRYLLLFAYCGQIFSNVQTCIEVGGGRAGTSNRSSGRYGIPISFVYVWQLSARHSPKAMLGCAGSVFLVD